MLGRLVEGGCAGAFYGFLQWYEVWDYWGVGCWVRLVVFQDCLGVIGQGWITWRFLRIGVLLTDHGAGHDRLFARLYIQWYYCQQFLLKNIRVIRY